MPSSSPAKSPGRAAGNLEDFLSRCGMKDRVTIEKHLAIADAEATPDHGRLWRRLAAALFSLAPEGSQVLGKLAVLFFIPDGKYRMQVFALEDALDGSLQVYLPDVLADAIRKKIVAKTKEPGVYTIVKTPKQTVHIEELDASNTPEPAVHVKNMLGWNRKALRVTVPATKAGAAQAAAAEALCALAAVKWANAPART
ncbi:MAG TPA: hypothetical protein VG269_05380 [Tepidisphaeraceae bacterium]|jgi:hypothetical protein|nr:hypothetical protein [Tepidisphaeraceae bacterium]